MSLTLKSAAGLIGLAALLAPAVAAAQSSTIHCTAPDGHNIYWKISAGSPPTARWYRSGEWTDDICDNFDVTCEFRPAEYTIFIWGPEQGNGERHTVERWNINRTDGSYAMRTWAGQSRNDPVKEEHLGTCRPSAEPAPPRPIF